MGTVLQLGFELNLAVELEDLVFAENLAVAAQIKSWMSLSGGTVFSR